MIRRLYTVLGACALLATSLQAQTEGVEETVVFDLTTRDAFNQCTQKSIKYDHSDFDAWNYNNFGDYPYMYNYDLTDGYYNDYLTTPDLELKAGEMYVIYTTPSAYNTGKSATLSVLLGQGDNEEAYTTLKQWKRIPYVGYGETAEARELTFVVEQDGNYRISFFGEDFALYLKDTKICTRGVVNTPKSPDDFTVMPDPDGGLSVTISFTMPTMTLSGTEITTPLTYKIYRQTQAIKTATAAPGEKVTYTEEVGMEGTAIYGLQILNGEDATERQTITTFIGQETPSPVTDAAFAVDGDAYKVTWTAPAVGTHNVPLAGEKLTYTVTRYLNDVPTVVAENTTSTSVSDTFTFDGIQMLKYGITAHYGSKSSEEALTGAIKIGTAELPFADSFAGATFNPLWDNVAISGDKLWETSSAPVTYTALTEPYDNDGGLAYLKSCTYNATNQAMLATPAFAYHAGDNPVVNFALLLDSRDRKTDEGVKIQISRDYGDWEDVPGGHFTVKPDDGGDRWQPYSVKLAESLAQGCTSYRVAFTTINEYGYNIHIDAVNIFNQLAKDAAVSSLSVPATIKAGNTMTIAIKVENNGLDDLAAADYTLSLDTDFPEEITLPENVAIPSLSSHTFTVDVPVHSLHAETATTFSFTAHVALDGDLNTSNDTSATAQTEITFSAGRSAENLSGRCLDDGTVVLNWDSAKDLSHAPVGIVESFEEFEQDYNQPNIGPWNGWSTIDIDGRAGDTWYGASGSIFRIDDNNNFPTGRDGKNTLSVTTSSYKAQDDWLISPLLDCKEGNTMALATLIAFKEAKSYYSPENTVELRYTTDDEINVLNPAANFTVLVDSKTYEWSNSNNRLNNSMFELTFTDIPAEARRVALHFTATKGTTNGAVAVDNLRLTEIEDNPLLGYHVYSTLNGRMNAELISAEATEYTIPAGDNSEAALFTERHPVFLTAVYPDGEAPRSNYLDLAEITGIEDVIAGSEATTDAEAEYFDLSGHRLSGAPAPGIYIRRQGTKVEKVAIR